VVPGAAPTPIDRHVPVEFLQNKLVHIEEDEYLKRNLKFKY
jgi:hypothetical protein